jgi:hypothetical protein
MRAFRALAAGLALTTSALAADRELSLTIYSSADPAGFDPRQVIDIAQRQDYTYPQQITQQVPGFAVVRDSRVLDLKQGANEIALTDVAAFIDPTTVSLVDLSAAANAEGDGRVKVLEQKFQFDLVSQQKVLERYVDKQIDIVGVGSGKLLSAQANSLVLQTKDGVQVVQLGQERANIHLGQLPNGLITKPTLRWGLLSPSAGEHKVQTVYQTDGITWRADYNLVLNQDETQADLGAWVSIVNLSGVTYDNATLKLVAGDVQRVQPQPSFGPVVMASPVVQDSLAVASAFQEKPFFEYHLYTLPRKTTIDQNSTQQLALFDTKHGVKVEKTYVYYGLPADVRYRITPEPDRDRNLGTRSNKKVDVYVQLENKEANHLGMPMPRGKVRVYKADQPTNPQEQAPLEFVGEDLIDHTARNEKLLVKVGQAFDLTGERVQADYQENFDQHWIEETYRITVRNAKSTPVKVLIRENLFRWVNWQITQKSADYEKVDSRTIHFPVDVPAADGDKSGEATVTYTVKYTW